MDVSSAKDYLEIMYVSATNVRAEVGRVLAYIGRSGIVSNRYGRPVSQSHSLLPSARSLKPRVALKGRKISAVHERRDHPAAAAVGEPARKTQRLGGQFGFNRGQRQPVRGQVDPRFLGRTWVSRERADFHHRRQPARERRLQHPVHAPRVRDARFLPRAVEPLAAHAGQAAVAQEIVGQVRQVVVGDPLPRLETRPALAVGLGRFRVP